MASTAASAHAIVLEVLNQHNYKDWSDRVKTYLLAEDLWHVVKPSEATKKKKKKNNRVDEDKDLEKKNARALHAIKISCGTEMFSFIRKQNKAKEAWEALKKNFKLRAIVRGTRRFDLHKAASEGNVDEVKRLLKSARPKDLRAKDDNGRTALDAVVVASASASASCAEEHWIQIATDMLIKNPNIVKIRSWPGRYIPVVRACSRNNWEMARCLYKHTPLEALLTENGRSGAQIITMSIWRPKGLDVAWDLLKKHLKFALADDGLEQQSMLVLAGNRRAFKSGARLTLWQKIIYKSIHIKSFEFTTPEEIIPERHIAVSEFEDEPSPKNISEADQRHQRNLFCSEESSGTNSSLDSSPAKKTEKNDSNSEKPCPEINEKYPSDPGNRPPISSYHPNVQDEVRRYYLQKGPCQPRAHEFPITEFGRKKRRFVKEWFDDFPTWLEYSIKNDAAYCLCCYLFKQGGGDTFVGDRFKNWKKKSIVYGHIGGPNSTHNKAQRNCEALLNQKQRIETILSYIENDIFTSIDDEVIMQRFQNMKSRRGQLPL